MLDFIVKLGGSVLTNKAVEEAARPDAIEENVNILSESFKAGNKFVVLHGVGSFGHHLAAKYKLNAGYSKDDKDIPLLLARIRSSLLKLNRQVVDEFIKRNVPAVTVSTFEDWKTLKGKVAEHCTRVVKRLLDDGFLPVLHGDWVFDDVQGCGILSSDTIMEILCECFHPRKVIFVLDSGCILSHPPNHPESRPIRKLLVSEEDDSFSDLETGSLVPDASGGMKAKVEAAISIARRSRGAIAVLFCPAGEAMDDLCNHREIKDDQLMTELFFRASRDA